MRQINTLDQSLISRKRHLCADSIFARPRRFASIGLTALLAWSAGTPPLWADDELGWFPEMLYLEQMSEEDGNSDMRAEEAVSPPGAAAGLAEWAHQPPRGPEGRPLPVTGSWMSEGMFGPTRFAEMIEDGHHVLLTFTDPNFVSLYREIFGNKRSLESIMTRYLPGLEYARKHNLPIAIRGWNWDGRILMLQEVGERAGREIALEDRANVILDGKPTNLVDPFGPVQAWRDWGAFWFGNEVMREIQRIYPDPPMVIFLNNNEGPKVRNPNQIPNDYERMLDFLGGEAPANERAKGRAIREGYDERYGALFESARDALVAPAWKQNVKFVAYNNLWDTGYIGQGNRPQAGMGFEPDTGWTEWRRYDGGMPEVYDNDWQLGKTDYSPWSPQTEAMNYYSTQDYLYAENPDFYWATITWDGGRTSNVWRGRRGTSKTYHYITRGQRWDFERYEGWVQFTLWTTRARSFREFRGDTPERELFLEGTFDAMVRSVDRPWKHDVLREFWRFGELVPNKAERPWWEVSDNQPDWIKDLERWYLLTADANPPREEWTGQTELRVFSQALVLGEAPERRWLIYAHAPLGAVADVTVTVPDHGNVLLPSVSKSGAFFLLREQTDALETLIAGGPHELSLRAQSERPDPGAAVVFEASVLHAPEATWTGFTWDFGDGRVAEAQALGTMEHSYAAPGEYIVTVRGHRNGARDLIEQVAVQIGEQPDEAVLYDLSLAQALDWEGPWADTGEPDYAPINFRHLPNRGRLPSPVVVGGNFVSDDERGMVYEMNGGEHAGIYLLFGEATNLKIDGYANKEISFWFKAEATEGRQVLYAEGTHHTGLNIYLDDDTVYAGAWAPTDGKMFDWHPIYGRNWKGDWVSHAGIEAGRWYQLSMVFDDAGEQVEADKMHLYLDGERVAMGPAARLPRTPAAPRLGRTHLNGLKELLSVFHDGRSANAKPFRGRLSGFRLVQQ